MRGLVKRVLWGIAALAMVAGTAGMVSAQAQIDGAFSETLIRKLGYPEVTVTVSPDGVVAPAELAAGPHLITLEAAKGLIGYVDIMQQPPGLSKEEATKLALAAASDDLARSDWVYLGGTNTAAPDEPVSFVIDLPPGEYQWAASSYHEDGSDEILYLAPLTVTGEAATPVAEAAALPVAGVSLQMTDHLQYLIAPDPVPAGPQIWKLENAGMHSPHHVVMFRVPDGTTSDQIVGEFQAMLGGTPPSGDSVMAQATWVGYAALQSGGRTTWNEFDLEPATYAVACFIVDPVTGRPHLMDGMVTVFTVA